MSQLTYHLKSGQITYSCYKITALNTLSKELFTDKNLTAMLEANL